MSLLRKTLPLGFAPLLVALAAAAPSAPVRPDRSKAERVGYVVEVEGGEEGPKSVFIPAKNRRDTPAPVSNSVSPPKPGGASPSGSAGGAPSTGGGSSEGSMAQKTSLWARMFYSRTETVDVDSALNKTSKKEEELSSRRYVSKQSGLMDSKLERRNAVGFEMWEHRFDSYGRKRNESVDMEGRFEAGRVDKVLVTHDRVEFNDFERRSDKAEIRNWEERQARDFSEKYADPDKRSSFRDRLATGYSLMSKVSMQDINRYQYRRNRSDEKGDLPVAKPGVEARSMKDSR